VCIPFGRRRHAKAHGAGARFSPGGTGVTGIPRRDRIIEAARQVFAERGLAGATLRAIAACAGCTTGAIYPHFSGKQEIYAEILNGILDALLAAMAREIAADADDRARLRGAASAFLDFYLDRPVEIGLALYLFDGIAPTGLTPRLNRELNAKVIATLRLFEDLIRRICGGLLAEDDLRSEGAMLFSYLMGLIIVHHTGRVRVIGRPSRQLLARHVAGLIDRLERRRADAHC
jgi:TetR/AcrR family transcriptional regulator